VARRTPADIRNVAFPVALRGYDRRAVDTYVTRVNRMLAELEATRSPEAAVKRALEHSEDERRGIIDQARAVAEKITAAAQREADETAAKARAEAADIVVNAGAEADRTTNEADKHVARARTDAEKILDRSRTEAAERLQRAQEEIEALRQEAQAWLQELRADTDAVWAGRRELLGDLREVALRLQQAASQSAAGAESSDRSAV
jgi:DivIVA domain-containing protein